MSLRPKLCCFFPLIFKQYRIHIAEEYAKRDWVAVKSVKNNKRQRRKRQPVTAKREKSQTPKVLTAILTLCNLT